MLAAPSVAVAAACTRSSRNASDASLDSHTPTACHLPSTSSREPTPTLAAAAASRAARAAANVTRASTIVLLRSGTDWGHALANLLPGDKQNPVCAGLFKPTPGLEPGTPSCECFSRVSLCHSEFVEVARNGLQMELFRQLVPNVAGHFVTAFDGGMLAEMLAK